MDRHLTAVATHLPTPHADYTEARLIRLALQAKVQRLRDELAHALEQFQDAIQREDAMQKVEHD